jgi:hypothetical protein
MQIGISYKSPSLSTHYLRMIAHTNECMATCTGFLYEFEEELFVITNGHNVTRMNPEQTVNITGKIGFPTKIYTKLRQTHPTDSRKISLGTDVKIDLYEDEDFLNPLWYIHPIHGYLVDVIAIPLEKLSEIPSILKLYPINKMEFDTEFCPLVADDIFILGYPLDIKIELEFPIWKRGSIATEPIIDIDALPKFYVDTASRSGMSGSPVIMSRTGLHNYRKGQVSGQEMIGTVSNFVGIYSGRLGAKDMLEAQIGIVWKEKVILEILNGKKKGTTTFQKF